MNLVNIILIGVSIVFELCLADVKSLLKLPNGRIVGGYVTSIKEIPWQVSSQHHSSHHCGGTIIGSQWVITAAHCTNNKLAENLAVRIGSSRHRSGGIIVNVKHIFQHPKYNSKLQDYDFSIYELVEPLNFTNRVQPIALPDADTKILDGTMCRVSGWGYTKYNSTKYKELLRATNVPVANQQYCNEQYKGKLTQQMICAGYKDGGRDSCAGDSGGPLFTIDEIDLKPKLVGLVSFGIGCAEPNHFGVYSRITSIRKWIESVTGF